MYVDGVVATVIDTYQPSVEAFQACNITTGSSGTLSGGSHNVSLINDRTDFTGTTRLAMYFIDLALVVNYVHFNCRRAIQLI
jgi:hypothetical protein